MGITQDINDYISSCGGEDVIRWLIKEDGHHNWENTPLYPILTWNPKYSKKILVAGIAYGYENSYFIIASKYEYKNEPKFDEWVQYLIEMGGYEESTLALLDNNMAIIANEKFQTYADKYSWEIVFKMLHDGLIASNFKVIDTLGEYYELNENDTLDSIDNNSGYLWEGKEASKLLDAFSDLLNYSEIVVEPIQNNKQNDFSNKFKENWI